ncbi:hypothetical protein EDD18DRAFT_1417533 [Armillaria luteobubalina]|uniref:Uncharacterized protein n=1 Tax=Armillaria luteobubalina TaxID=153913 RepID=A0AA39PT15_9AGAR|nr:hypothetical protein EDD18DRAFT_1417533 [Armillaria luteobubalina]
MAPGVSEMKRHWCKRRVSSSMSTEAGSWKEHEFEGFYSVGSKSAADGYNPPTVRCIVLFFNGHHFTASRSRAWCKQTLSQICYRRVSARCTLLSSLGSPITRGYLQGGELTLPMVAWKGRVFLIYFNKALIVAAFFITLRIDAAPLPISFIPARRFYLVQYLGK